MSFSSFDIQDSKLKFTVAVEADARDLFTSVLLDNFFARLAAHVATPLELAVASLLDDNLLRVIAATATEDRAAVQSGRRSIALSAMCA